jgi:hypothetical protein
VSWRETRPNDSRVGTTVRVPRVIEKLRESSFPSCRRPGETKTPLGNDGSLLAIVAGCRLAGRGRLLLGPTAAQLFHAAADFGLEAAVDRFVVTPCLRQIVLRHPAAGVIVAVLVALAVAELFGARIVRVAQVFRHRQRPAGAKKRAKKRDADSFSGTVGSYRFYTFACFPCASRENCGSEMRHGRLY